MDDVRVADCLSSSLASLGLFFSRYDAVTCARRSGMSFILLILRIQLYKLNSPYFVSCWLVTKRLVKGLVIRPEGWPNGSSLLKEILESYKVLKLCPMFWSHAFLQKLEEKSLKKPPYVIRSINE
jgi:hypothetical protein